MAEKDISSQIKDILSSFEEVTGYTPELSISDFIMIRKEAIEELNACKSKVFSKPIVSVSSKPIRENVKADISRKNTVKILNTDSVIKNSDIEDEILNEDVPEDIEKSDFEILASIPDEWN